MPRTPDFRDLVVADLSQYLLDQAVKDFEKSLESGE
ncbi:hypothetical protein SEA_STEPHANIEG_36 [Mycobacterium phage StephanieG]|nr:hypothetical protein SEA_STEPHANIEG_36 [Mycobacterium phage StephanieG]